MSRRYSPSLVTTVTGWLVRACPPELMSEADRYCLSEKGKRESCKTFVSGGGREKVLLIWDEKGEIQHLFVHEGARDVLLSGKGRREIQHFFCLWRNKRDTACLGMRDPTPFFV